MQLEEPPELLDIVAEPEQLGAVVLGHGHAGVTLGCRI
jgi:hypothetical protein